MLIVVEDIAAKKNSGGVFSVLSDFYDQVCEYGGKHDWVFILNDYYFEEKKNIKIIVKKDTWLSRLVYTFVTGKYTVNKLNPDIYISLQNIVTFGVKSKVKWTYVHQPIPFQKSVKFNIFKKNERVLAIQQYMIGTVIKKSIKYSNANVVVQTKWMKKAVEKQCRIDDENVKIVTPTDLISDEIPRYQSQKTLQFFYPANPFIYKNHKVIINAIDILKKQGIINFNVIFTNNISDFDNDLPNNVKLIGHVAREKVFDLYSKSILIFPSYIESYGLPLLEARRSGTFILASDTSFSREILEGYPNYTLFEYNDAKTLAKQMKQIIEGRYVIKRENNYKEKETNKLINIFTNDEVRK